MSLSTDRLGLAPEVQSFARLGGRCSRKSEAPAATRVAVPVCETETRDLATPQRLRRSKGADMAQSTRGFPRSDSETRDPAVKITPARSVSDTVPTTLSIA